MIKNTYIQYIMYYAIKLDTETRMIFNLSMFRVQLAVLCVSLMDAKNGQTSAPSKTTMETLDLNVMVS